MHVDIQDDILHELLADLPPALGALLIPGLLMYMSLYALAKRWRAAFWALSVASLAGFWASESVAPVRCAGLRTQLNFGVAIATMKLLDILALSFTRSFPSYTSGTPPQPSSLALILLTELRYESFTPNPIRLPVLPSFPFPNSPSSRKHFYSEPVQYIIHLLLLAILQSLPQYLAVKALSVLLTIWIIWTTMQLLLRYPTSPPLFGPLYVTDSLASFWTEIWHNVFASPCYSLAYTPVFYALSKLKVPRPMARSAGVVSAFGLMAVFHMYALAPLLSAEGRTRIGWFFVGNGILTVIESKVWGRKKHWLRALAAWVLELGIASWTVQAADLPDGVVNVNWRGICTWKNIDQ